MKSVTLLGLGAIHASDRPKKRRGELWTMNDWYAFRGPFRYAEHPQRVYNTHETMLESEAEVLARGRFRGWREAYERSGATIVTLTPLGFSRERLFDMRRAADLYPTALAWSSTWAYMIADAILDGFERIVLERITLFSNGEYLRQGPGLLMCINEARRRGIAVHWPYEAQTRRKMATMEMGTMDVNMWYGAKAFCNVRILTEKVRELASGATVVPIEYQTEDGQWH